VKRVRIGRRRRRGDAHAASPLELALTPALVDGRWQVPDRFNFARDVVEVLAGDPKRRGTMFLGPDGVIEPRTFLQLAEGGAGWASLLRERGVKPGDRVLVLEGPSVDWLEIVLGCLKTGAVTVPSPAGLSEDDLDTRVSRSGAKLVVAARQAEAAIALATERPAVLYVDEGRQLAKDAPDEAPTHDTSARDVAFILWTPGTASPPKAVAHTHASAFAARAQAEHWLDAGRGDVVWCTAGTGTDQVIWNTLLGPWSRGAEIVLHGGDFDAEERLDLIHRLEVSILLQTPAEFRALAPLRELRRFRPPRLRRLVSTGDYLDPDVVAFFEEAWGLTIHDGYGQAETNILVANGAEAGFRAGSMGLPIPGHQVAVIDDQGNELPPGIEGDLAVRARTPTLFAGYWESPEETKDAFRGDWYVTGDVATADEDGFLWFVGRAEDVITSRGRTFGPYEIERTLGAHAAVAGSAVVGMRDLERGGHFVRAFVVLTPGLESSEQLEAELRHYVGESLPEQQVPREIEFIEELPTTASGRLRRVELRERPLAGRPLWEMPPTSETEPEPELVPPPIAWAAEPEPERFPSHVVEPAVEPRLEPGPVVEPEPVPPVPEPAVEPAPVVEPEHVPEYGVPEAEPEPVAETASELEIEPEAEHEPDRADMRPVFRELLEASAEPGSLPDYIVDPESAPEPVVEAVREPEPAPALEPEPELGPLPDYVVDPNRPRQPVAEAAREPDRKPVREAAPEPKPEPRVPKPADLALKPLTEFPSADGEPREPARDRDATPPPPRPSPVPGRKPKRQRSTDDPGDEPQETGWMHGLSTRLSAYSLAEEGAGGAPEEEDEGDSEDAERP
jgi:acetyl-CoA synthetase/medium-chain acyl-CoA synthetase